jgi:hypothetical protein
MSAKLTFLRALVVGTVSGVLTSACQTYDFEPVEPLAISQTTETRTIEARASKPNLMLLVDTSGSMTAPVDPTLPGCKVGTQVCGDSNPCNTSVCPTRWSDLQAAMSSFLSESGSIARIGLTTYPDLAGNGGDECGTSSSVSVPFPADTDEDAALLANAELVKNKLLSIKNSTTTNEQTPKGGTPTSLSLQYVGGRPEMQGANRADFVVLLTDGLPNCNANYPSPFGTPNSTCFCILANGNCTFAPEIGCLDTDASVGAVKQLLDKQIQTIVIGFGTDFKANTEAGRRGAATLNGMAEAGGFKRECSTNAQCGTDDTCDTSKGLCTRRFFQAGNKTELVEALKAIANKVIVDKPCELRIEPAERPSTEELVVVYLNKERLSPGPETWTLKEPGIVFQGATCARIESSSPSSPANIEVRAVQTR